MTLGAYLSVIGSLGLELTLVDPQSAQDPAAPPPAKIRLSQYPQLRRLAWQLKRTTVLTPEEALSVYERNWRHVVPDAMEPGELELLNALLAAFGRKRLNV